MKPNHIQLYYEYNRCYYELEMEFQEQFPALAADCWKCNIDPYHMIGGYVAFNEPSTFEVLCEYDPWEDPEFTVRDIMQQYQGKKFDESLLGEVKAYDISKTN